MVFALDATGKLDASIIPAVAITNTNVVADETEMIGLTANIGDVAVRNDVSITYILKTAPPTTLANWVELKTPCVTIASETLSGKAGNMLLQT
jgi:hypothetical protein